jgi:hypothetical protein
MYAIALVISLMAADRHTIGFRLHGEKIEGTPLHWSSGDARVLSRDGRLLTFSPHSVTSVRQISSSFASYPRSVLIEKLQAEFGSAFRINATKHYIVVQHEAIHSQWAEKFEELYASFELYFSVRDFRLHEPDFPLIAIVWPDRETFARAAIAEGHAPKGVLGYYSPTTNRISLYDRGVDFAFIDPGMNVRPSGNPVIDELNADVAEKRRRMWEHAGLYRTSATILHEATHQVAFNTGVHQRFHKTPRWLSEGLAMLFEAKGVWNSRTYPRREDRINRERFKFFHQFQAPNHVPALVKTLVTDELFAIDSNIAYCEAWAFSFFLVETQPRKYAEYLALTAKRSGNQLTDFTSIFGGNFDLLSAKFLRFMAELR